ncbi:hypothetical protein CCL11_08940 [Pseudomonas syringae]|nr:hypothetical protein CCL11_24775 [Pseudomonas syringae]PBP47374.1 hypothetical protein CCL11_08940 [Pseudomonas syringae]
MSFWTSISDVDAQTGRSFRPPKPAGKLWPLMTAEQILNRSEYRENDTDRAELKELLENLLKLVA